MSKLKWQQCMDQIRTYIVKNNLVPGDPLPPDHKLAQMAGCSLQPISRAMRELARQGEVSRRAGAPTRVMDIISENIVESFSFSASACSQGYIITSRVVEFSCRLPQEGDDSLVERRAQKALKISEKAEFLILKRLRIRENVPVALQNTFLNPEHIPEELRWEHDFSKESLFALYKNCGITPLRRDTSLTARAATVRESKLLGLPEPYMPILSAEQVMWGSLKNGIKMIPIEYLQSTYIPGWHYTIKNRI